MTQAKMYIQTLQRSWWIIALTTLAAFTLALLMAYNETPQYSTNTRFVISPITTIEKDSDIVNTVESQPKLMGTYAEILNSNMIWDQSAQRLGLTAGQANDYERKAVVLPEASVLELTVTGPDPELAATLANQVGQEAISYVKGLYPVYDISLLDPATVPDEPYSPNIVRSAAVAAVVGFVIGIVLALLREQVILAYVSNRQTSPRLVAQ